MTNLIRELEKTKEIIKPDTQTVGPISRIVDSLAARYEEPWRHYHGLRHLTGGLSFLIDNLENLKNPRAVLLAYLGHDSIYIPQLPSGLNERLSSELTTRSTMDIVDSTTLGLVTKYILSTYDHNIDSDPDQSLMLDTDLMILGSTEKEYDDYSDGIRAEFCFVPAEQYRAGRSAVLQSFLGRQRIYQTIACYEQFEKQARWNIAREIDALT